MPPESTYQVVLLDPGSRGLGSTLRLTVQRRVADLGLQPEEHLRFLDHTNDERDVQWQNPVVGVYFGCAGAPSTNLPLLHQLLDRFALVLPVVDSTESYATKVPPCLHELNGAPLDASDPELETLAARVLEALRLSRRHRAAFVSYRRAESRGVASQLFHALEERRYRVFLDTFSVEHGCPFQEALWGRMLDTDVLVFLHTKGALASRWVEEEFSRAAQLGLGILNVVWPGHSCLPAAGLGQQFQLERTDFRGDVPFDDASSELTFEATRRLAVAVEALQARATADRRRRVVGTFCRRVDAFARRTGVRDIHVLVQSDSHLEIRFGKRRLVRIYPVIGHPRTEQAREASDACAVLDSKGYLVFDSNGLDDETVVHLRWLNRFLPVQSFATTETDEWLPRL